MTFFRFLSMTFLDFYLTQVDGSKTKNSFISSNRLKILYIYLTQLKKIKTIIMDVFYKMPRNLFDKITEFVFKIKALPVILISFS